MSANRLALLGAALLLSSCTHYSDFTLPPLAPAIPPVKLSLRSEPQPIIKLDLKSSDVLNPSVLYHDNQYFNLYSEYDGNTWYTDLATSPNGFVWTNRGRVLSPGPAAWEGDYIAANGSALWRNGECLYWYQSGPRGSHKIGLARSRDGVHFRKEVKPVLEPGPYRSWDERDVADPYVIETGGHLFMFYLGQDRADRQRIGVARSRDGVSWEKLLSNPVLELSNPGTGALDENGLGEPAVFIWKGAYWMLFTGRDAHEYRRIGVARSSDGIHWTRFSTVFSGEQPWNSKVMCDPTVLVENGKVRVWFGGGDTASPAEGLHGQIGVATLMDESSQ